LWLEWGFRFCLSYFSRNVPLRVNIWILVCDEWRVNVHPDDNAATLFGCKQV